MKESDKRRTDTRYTNKATSEREGKARQYKGEGTDTCLMPKGDVTSVERKRFGRCLKEKKGEEINKVRRCFFRTQRQGEKKQ